MTKRVIKVWHIGGWNRNFGDWALAYQMHRLLNEQGANRGIHFDFYLVDGQRTYFHPRLVDHLIEEADMVILGAGGCVFHRPEDQSCSGWILNVSLADLERIDVPIVVYGIGYNQFPYDSSVFPPVTRRHLGLLQKKSRLFSARNHGSRAKLIEEFGLDPAKLHVSPDPGICLYDRPIAVPARRSEGPVIGVNLAGDRPGLRYPEPGEENQRVFFTTLKRALQRCVRDLRAQIMFLPHIVGVDTDFYGEFAEGFPAGSIFSVYDGLPFLFPPPGELLYPHVPFFTNLFRQADLVLGMRGHSGILSFGAQTKFIPLGEHQKLKYFAQDVGTPMQYAIPSAGGSAEDADLWFDRIRACLSDEVYARMLPAALANQFEILRGFNERVLDVAAESEGGQ